MTGGPGRGRRSSAQRIISVRGIRGGRFAGPAPIRLPDGWGRRHRVQRQRLGGVCELVALAARAWGPAACETAAGGRVRCHVAVWAFCPFCPTDAAPTRPRARLWRGNGNWAVCY
ncbi:hypothetical protein ZWY2020_002978 [Hordeum vulgare]|nr:hypothetical protein ZWY2020_002978 [Hordeum vulgare]